MEKHGSSRVTFSASGKPICFYLEKCYRKKEEHFAEYDHPHLNTLLEKSGIAVPRDYRLQTSSQTLLLQLKIVSKLRSSNTSSLSSEVNSSFQSLESANDTSQSAVNNIPEKACQAAAALASPDKPQTSSQCLSAMRQSLEFIKNNSQRIHITIAEKWKASAPYYILYTSLENNQDMANDKFSVIFSELLDSSFGTLDSSLLINFMVEFGWVLACYHAMDYRRLPMTLLYGECDEELDSRFDSFLTSDKVKPPSPFGSHHTKMMIYSYVDESIRVVVCTANLVESDWRNKTQGLWISPKCCKLPDDASNTAGDSETNFKSELLRYLRNYRLNSLQKWIEKVERADMSHIKVVFVASVPGTHSAVEKWGQCGVKAALREHVAPPHKNDIVIVQCSSIGSLGPNADSFLTGQIRETLTSNQLGQTSHLPLHLIYPSFRDVEASADGLLGGGCLPYNSSTHRKQEWLHSYLRRWKSDKIGRTRAIPHIKSYTRVSGDLQKAAYFLLTSANMSKAAWGRLSKSGTINILSYEAGVLFLPKLLIGSEYLPLTKESSEVAFSEGKPIFTLPYDLPLVNYSDTDIPWFIDNFTN